MASAQNTGSLLQVVFSAPALIASTTATRASSDKLESGSAGNLAQTTAKAIKDLEKSYRLQVGIRKKALVGSWHGSGQSRCV